MSEEFLKQFLTISHAVVGDPLMHPNLRKYLDRPVAELIQFRPPAIPPEHQERHRIYSLLLMAIVYRYWNGNKRGRRGEYPRNELASVGDGPYLDNDYLGHNIAAICVDGDGRVIDFDFNHNTIFNSSMEHAEARTVRRVYGLTQINDTWNITTRGGQVVPKNDYNMLERCTVYTTLEPCSQCAGIMALGRVGKVVYLQSDPGMYLIGNILRNLTTETSLEAPMPIAASLYDFEFYELLNEGYLAFTQSIKADDAPPFFIGKDGRPDRSLSITSFLCTKTARDIYGEAMAKFFALVKGDLQLDAPDYRPLGGDMEPIETALSNAECIRETADFYNYAVNVGRRGTPHH